MAFNSKDSRIESRNLGSEGRNFRFCFHTQKGPPGGDRLHQYRVIPPSPTNGVITPPLSEEDPIRAPPASTSRPSYTNSLKCPSDSNFPKNIAFDIMFFLDNTI